MHGKTQNVINRVPNILRQLCPIVTETYNEVKLSLLFSMKAEVLTKENLTSL